MIFNKINQGIIFIICVFSQYRIAGFFSAKQTTGGKSPQIKDKQMKKSFFLRTLLGAITIVTCAAHDISTHDHLHHHMHSYDSHSDDHHKAHWGYGKDNGPKQWGKLDEAYKLCDLGHNQSPISIPTHSAQKSAHALKTAYLANSVEFINNGHTLQVNYKNSGKLLYENKPYELLQFHFHTPSETYIDQKGYPLEIHFVNKSANDTLLVLAVLVKEGKANKHFSQLIAHLPEKEGQSVALKGFNPTNLLPKKLGYYAFDGSLTTPPCSEMVQWVVLKDYIFASKEQIEALHRILQDNARDLQELNDRVIKVAN